MTYQPKFPECPYKATNNNKCVHKKNGKYCGHKHPENCPYYCEWNEVKKIDSTSLKTLLNNTGDLT